MNFGQLHIRRATVDDLPALKSLWLAARLPVEELESRLTEFQIVTANGNFAGAVAVQIARQYLRFYAEDFTDFAVADAARELFWERIQKIAATHGVFRVWTQETSPFWTHWGFQKAVPAEMLERLPVEWKGIEGDWLTLELKNEAAITHALENQFSNFMGAERQQTDEVAKQAHTIRNFFTVAFFIIGGIGFALAVYLLLHHPLAGR